MQLQKVRLTELYDIAIALKCVEKENFSDELKHRILKTYFKPDGNFTFPKTHHHGCNRTYSLNYLNNLFVYSISSDSVFYIHCALFVSQEKTKNLNTFIKDGCSDWHNIIERQSIHVEQKHLKDAIKNILITLLIVLKNQKEPLTTTQIPLTMRGVINIQKA